MNSPHLPLRAVGVTKSYALEGGRTLPILLGVDLEVQRGEAVAIVGQSGSGKSTLLHLLGGLDQSTEGEISLDGTSLKGLDREALARVRNRSVGFVFQFHHLLREFTALENASMPALIQGMSLSEATDRARGLLAAVGLSHRSDHRPWQLSGGEQQRVAVARALVNHPPLLLADEPSGNLDARTSEELHDLLFRIREERGLSLVLVTHNPDLAARADRILTLVDGVLEGARPTAPTEGPSNPEAPDGGPDAV
jgi:lipoprotein-releasing system ATP-binding protein